MAVLVPNKSWTTYQDKQLNILKDMEKDLYKTLGVTTSIDNNLADLPDVIYSAANLLVHSIDAIWNSRDLPDITGSLRNLENSIERSLGDIEDSIEETAEAGEDDDGEDLRELNDSVVSLRDVIRELELGKLVKYIGQQAEGFTNLYNETIRMTGANKQEAQNFRKDIIGIVDDINNVVGSKLNSQEVLDTMLSISNQTSISNTETLKAITKPVILAQESMAIDIGQFSQLAGKFYTKYNFTSNSLTGLVNHLRNSTEGKDVSEQVLLTALEKLGTRIALSSDQNADVILELQKGLTSGVSWLESNYVDSASYLEDLYKFMSSDVRDRVGMATKYGDSTSKIMRLIEEGKLPQAMELMLSTISTYDVLTAAARGIDTELWEEAQATTLSKGFATLEEYLESIDESQIASESLEDKFVSIQDQIKNELTNISRYVSDISEDIGIGVGDITLLASILGNIWSVTKMFGISKGFLSGAGGTAGGALAGGAAGGAVAGLLKGGLLTAELAALALIPSSGVAYESIWAKDIAAGLSEGLTGDALYDYVYRSTSIGTNTTTGPNGKKLSDQEKQALAKQEFDSFYQAYVTSYAIAQSEDFYNRLHDSFADQIASGGNITEDFLRETLGNLGAGYLSQDVLGALLNAMYGGGYKTPLLYSGSYADNSIDSYLKSSIQVGAKSDWSDLPSLDELSAMYGVDIPGYATGTNYISRNQLAYLHEGEAVVPEEYNPAANMNELERLREETREKDDAVDREMVGYLREIKEFISLWKDESHRDNMLNNTKSHSIQRQNLTNYMR